VSRLNQDKARSVTGRYSMSSKRAPIVCSSCARWGRSSRNKDENHEEPWKHEECNTAGSVGPKRAKRALERLGS
jgi:hypothetical protein